MYNQLLVPLHYGARGNALVSMARTFERGQGLTMACPSRVETAPVSDSTLLVTDELPTRTDVDVLLTKGEPRLRRRPAMSPRHVEVLPILVPFGSGPSGIQAAKLAQRLASRTLSRDVAPRLLFYHTTWRKPGVQSEEGFDHLDEGARHNAMLLPQFARYMHSRQTLVYQILVELQAPTVVDGILRTALTKQAGIIVMARGSDVLAGSYVEQMAELSPVPLLIARKEG